MKLFVLDPHTIYRRGLAACLELLPGVEDVADVESIREAWEHPDLFTSELVLLDIAVPGGHDFIGAVTEATGARVLVCTSEPSDDAVLAALQSGAALGTGAGHADAVAGQPDRPARARRA